MTEYISTKFNVIHKDLKQYHQMTEQEADAVKGKENFKCFQFKHTYNENDTTTQIRVVDFKGGISYGEWSN